MRTLSGTASNGVNMVRDGLIARGKKGVLLTKAGRESARTVTRRYTLTEWMMAERLPWSRSHQEAHNLEHAISAEVETALLEELGHPQTCPHGNPLPGCEEATAFWIPLTKIAADEEVIIRRFWDLYRRGMYSRNEMRGIGDKLNVGWVNLLSGPYR